MALEVSLFSLFALMLTCTVDACQIHILQQGWMSKWSGSPETTLQCEVNFTRCVHNKGWRFAWFKFEANSHRILKFSGKYAQIASHLLIRNITKNDSGLYYCGVMRSNFTQRGVRDVGGGTLLVVREYSHVKHALVWTLFVILALYSLALLFLLILKKMQRKMPPFAVRGCSNSRKEDTMRSARFQNVVQELYSKRNLPKHVNKHCLTPVQPKDQVSCSASVDETVYQNM